MHARDQPRRRPFPLNWIHGKAREQSYHGRRTAHSVDSGGMRYKTMFAVSSESNFFSFLSIECFTLSLFPRLILKNQLKYQNGKKMTKDDWVTDWAFSNCPPLPSSYCYSSLFIPSSLAPFARWNGSSLTGLFQRPIWLVLSHASSVSNHHIQWWYTGMRKSSRDKRINTNV